ncbi:MAG: ribosome biogenesis GTPase YlqF [Tissierellia bacterium]|nr:ribosome biogenesis GTPase YlqF [Tissierellia bacterium]
MNNMNINWYPGHMKKAMESIMKNLALVDIAYEVIDSRIPRSSRNPEIDNILGGKPKIIIMNKSDLADEEANIIWRNYFQKQGYRAVIVDSTGNRGIDDIVKLSNRLVGKKTERSGSGGSENRSMRAIIIGIPNVGKSTLINNLSRRKGARTGNKPGITRANQWINVKGNLQLLDTPGILWPKFQDEEVGLNLAFTGAIKDEILDIENLALNLIDRIKNISKRYLQERYDIDIENKSPYEIIEIIGRKRGCLIQGGRVDLSRTSGIILDEYRKGLIGRITLELPEGRDVY